jgi:hypothetical protein
LTSALKMAVSLRSILTLPAGDYPANAAGLSNGARSFSDERNRGAFGIDGRIIKESKRRNKAYGFSLHTQSPPEATTAHHALTESSRTPD